MDRLRRIAFVILFAGWMLPAMLAQNARTRVGPSKPRQRSHIELMAGIEPPPRAEDRAITVLRSIAGVWFLAAMVYAGVLTIRFRRTLLG
jgi:hypothetical protein